MIARVISALVAAAVVIATGFMFHTIGLYAVCALVILGCIYEYSKLTLKIGKAPIHIQVLFILLAAGINAAALITPDFVSASFTVAAIVFLSLVVVDIRRTTDLSQAFKLASGGLTGFVYVGLFSGYALKTLGLESGLMLFFGLLAIVFAGDTCAYFAGRAFGKAKLLEAVSPKKTIAGSVGGLFGSGLIGFGLHTFVLPTWPAAQIILIAVVSGGFAQIGDLFESLLKRLANVKDSGRIMPGHGGFLDRLDGVLFAAPVYYLLLYVLQSGLL